MAKFLVTGGAGFIGSNLTKKLLELKHYVRVVDNFSTGKKENLREFLNEKNFELIKGDLSDLKTARKAVKNMEFVLHQAAIPSVQRSIDNPLKINKSNIDSSLNVLVAARDEGVKKLIYASSSSIYGDTPKLPKKESDPINPISPYALTKFTGEKYCQLFSKLYGLSTVCLRYFNVFGPRQNPKSQYSAAIPKFITAILNDRPPIIYGDGKQSRDFTYVNNVVRANILAAESKIAGQVINIACNKKINLNQIIALINKILDKKIKPVYQAKKPGDIRYSLADITMAKKLLNYRPEIDFEQGLKKTIEWYRSHRT